MADLDRTDVQDILIPSGRWTVLRTRLYGKVPASASQIIKTIKFRRRHHE
jgi:Na+-transporting NADH:ubiquinone oxidoreductase subunit NqrA